MHDATRATFERRGGLADNYQRVYVGESVQKTCEASVLVIENSIPLDDLNKASG